MRFFQITIVLFILMNSTLYAKSYSLGSTGFDFSGDIAITFRELDRHSQINTNFRGDDPFNTYRVRSFIAKDWNENIHLDIEFLWDNKAPSRINGAYFTFSELLETPLYAKVGLIPSPFGNYGHRSTYFNHNPLIGIPLMWHYHTPLSKSGNNTNSGLFPREVENLNGVPPGYDACWETGVSLHFDTSLFETTLAITQGTMSNPKAYDNDGYQGILKIGIKPVIGAKIGLSGAYGSWMRPDVSVSLPEDLESYMQKAYGVYFEYTFGHWQFYSELMNIAWDSPLVFEKELSLSSGYGELQWKFIPGWYIASRYDFMVFSEISTTDNGLGEKSAWGYDMDRIEVALGYRVIREGYIRFDYQKNLFRSDEPDAIDLLALQFIFAF